MLGVYAVNAGVPILRNRQIRRGVAIDVTVSGRRGTPDPNNLLKITLDAMKLAGLIVDDSPAWLDCKMPTVQRGEHTETVITFENLPNG